MLVVSRRGCSRASRGSRAIGGGSGSSSSSRGRRRSTLLSRGSSRLSRSSRGV